MIGSREWSKILSDGGRIVSGVSEARGFREHGRRSSLPHVDQGEICDRVDVAVVGDVDLEALYSESRFPRAITV